jgi:hypothetical protein
MRGENRGICGEGGGVESSAAVYALSELRRCMPCRSGDGVVGGAGAAAAARNPSSSSWAPCGREWDERLKRRGSGRVLTISIIYFFSFYLSKDYSLEWHSCRKLEQQKGQRWIPIQVLGRSSGNSSETPREQFLGTDRKWASRWEEALQKLPPSFGL